MCSAAGVLGRVDVYPADAHGLPGIRNIDNAIYRPTQRTVLEVQQFGKNMRGNKDGGGRDLDIAQHLSRLHFEIAIDRILDAAAGHTVKVHIGIEETACISTVMRVGLAGDGG